MVKKIDIPNNIAEELYRKATNSLTFSVSTESILDRKLILEIFAREIAIYVKSKYLLEENSFTSVVCRIEKELIQVSVGSMKKNVNESPTLTYGII